MNKTKLKSRLKYSFFFAYVILSIAIVISVFSWSSKKNTELKSEVAQSTSKQDSLELEIEKFKTLQLADDYYFKGEYNQAKTSYKSILNSYDLNKPQSNRIQDKLDRINEIKFSNENVSDEMRAFQVTLEKRNYSIDSLITQMDSLETETNKKLEEKSEKIKNLNNKNKDLNKKLAEKENVQVISFNNEQGDFIHYLGEVNDKKANGGGIGIWKTGSIYKGSWKDNQRHGKGMFEWSDGHIYEGEFINDKREGEGTYRWPSGEKYEGEWRNGKRNGEGTLYDRDGNVQYEGQWKDDKIAEN
ncbi:MAG: hypothetical protein WEA99_06175 [Brumimicrobium sp.]